MQLFHTNNQRIQLASLAAALNWLALVMLAVNSNQAAPTETAPANEALEEHHQVDVKQVAASEPAPAATSAAKATGQKFKRDSQAKVTSLELDTQETGYLPGGYQSADSDYGYDSGKNSYGKQASDWSLYDQGE